MKIQFSKSAVETCQKLGLNISQNDKILEKEALRLIRKASKALLEAQSLEVDVVDTATLPDWVTEAKAS